MHYNICIIRPQNYAHSSAFTELAELIAFGLRDLGHSAEIQENVINTSARNIVVGWHLLHPSTAEELHPSTIILNTEQLREDEDGWASKIVGWVSRFETWDYSRINLERLSTLPHAKLGFLPIGYHRNLARIGRAAEQDIDVLFYGSGNKRRNKIFNDLKQAGLCVHAVFGVYGQQRDALIARSKIVLNLHYCKSRIFEIVRVFYLMINAKCAVCEVDEHTGIDPCYLGGIRHAPYEGLVELCKTLARDAGLRRLAEDEAFNTIRLMPQGELMAPLLVE